MPLVKWIFLSAPKINLSQPASIVSGSPSSCQMSFLRKWGAPTKGKGQGCRRSSTENVEDVPGNLNLSWEHQEAVNLDLELLSMKNCDFWFCLDSYPPLYDSSFLSKLIQQIVNPLKENKHQHQWFICFSTCLFLLNSKLIVALQRGTK